MTENVRLLTTQVIQKAKTPDQAQKGTYYMTNINHPVIAELKRRFCEKHEIKQNIPLSDRERIEFELWLFQPSIRTMIEDICKEPTTEQVEKNKSMEEKS